MILEGQNPRIVYCLPTNNPRKRPNETDIFRHPYSMGKDLVSVCKFDTLQDVYKIRFIENKTDIGFAKRQMDPLTKKPTDKIDWYENGQVLDEAEKLGSGILHLQLAPEVHDPKFGRLQFVGVWSKNTLEYMQLEIACGVYGLVSIPVYDTLGVQAIDFIFEQTKMEICCLTASHLTEVLTARKKEGKFPYLRTLIVMDPVNIPKHWHVPEVSGIRLMSIDQVKEVGAGARKSWRKVHPHSVYCFSYTSGTTGVPKGAVLTHRNIVACFKQADLQLEKVYWDDLYLSYLPMAHVMERVSFNSALSQKGCIALYAGDVLALRDDIRVFRPTLFASVPRLFNRVYDAVVQGVRSKPRLLQMLFERCVRIKRENLAKNCVYTHSIYDKIVLRRAKNALGGRMRIMLSASAPISPEILSFLKVVFCCPVLEGYGQTEGSALEFITHPLDPEGGHVGGPTIQNEFKLVDIPEMGYTCNDKDELGNARPRGEIWVRGPNVIGGYYQAPERDAETFTADGWLMSGDVGELVGPERRLRIIDRKKNLFKLSQGEYIAPEKLENAYRLSHPLITGMYIYGDSLKNFLVAVVNMEEEGLKKFSAEQGVTGLTLAELKVHPAISKALLALFEATAKSNQFNSLEKPKAVVVETRTFQELGLLTEAFKLKRYEAKQTFGGVINQMYSSVPGN